jgi:UDP-sulfoquinovose synthase
MKVLVIGGDGFCGWPTALHLSAHGYEVSIVDNLSRRMIAENLGAHSLTPIDTMLGRQYSWHDLSGNRIPVYLTDVAASQHLDRLVAEHDAVIHFGEQRAAPYSMKTPRTRKYTVQNNIMGNTNLLEALVHSPRPLIHLGTAGVYGYSSQRVPEGWVRWNDEWRLHPMKPGSVYHSTKCAEQVLFEFYARNYDLAITDLHQGIVWGTQTEQTALHPSLVNRFDYDGDYGTVLNRFLMQAALGHPLTVHGSGGQTRAFIHIQDTVRCVRLALENPADWGQYRIFNQVAETIRVRDLARRVAQMVPEAQIDYLENPRKEADENDLEMENEGLQGLGWDPIRLRDDLLEDEMALALTHKNRANLNKVPCTSEW